MSLLIFLQTEAHSLYRLQMCTQLLSRVEGYLGSGRWVGHIDGNKMVKWHEEKVQRCHDCHYARGM